MPTAKEYLPVFLDMGDALLGSGAEIFRVEDTLNRMGYACGATQMNVLLLLQALSSPWNFQVTEPEPRHAGFVKMGK